MNRKLILLSIILALLGVAGFRLAFPAASPQVLSRNDVYKGRIAAFCAPDWTTVNTDSLAASIVPLPGWGNYSWNLTSTSDSAQFYYDQGISMYYAFHIIESMASFKKAATFDNTNPHIYWAQALAYGPNINDFEYAASAEALVMAGKAKEYAAQASAKDRALIDAMLTRYSADTGMKRSMLNIAYAEAMGKVYERFSNDADVIALYADALMLLHPWEYWKHNGEPHPWTPRILEVIELGLKVNPRHPGLNHYYIHAAEASPDPGRALASADRLGAMMPMVSHMVHMPSHIYITTGDYAKAVAVNELSVKGYQEYKMRFAPVEQNAGLYLIHNLHMQAASAMFLPDYSYSLQTANQARNSFDTSFLSLPVPMGSFIQYVYMTPVIAHVRYGRWDSILSAPAISTHHRFAYALSIWATGMANVNKNKLHLAAENLETLRELMMHDDLQIVLAPFNSAGDALKVAQRILYGTLLEKSGKQAEAIDAFKEAVKHEEALIYNEPRDWMIPARHYLANAQINAKKFNEAEATLLKDLKINPDNYYALAGMEFLLRKAGQVKEATVYKNRLKGVKGKLVY